MAKNKLDNKIYDVIHYKDKHVSNFIDAINIEINVLDEFNHHGIRKIIEFFEDESGDIYIVREYC